MQNLGGKQSVLWEFENREWGHAPEFYMPWRYNLLVMKIFIIFIFSCLSLWNFSWAINMTPGPVFEANLACQNKIHANSFIFFKKLMKFLFPSRFKLVVWLSGSCEHMNSSAQIILHLPSITFMISPPVVLKQSINKGCLLLSSFQQIQNPLC